MKTTQLIQTLGLVVVFVLSVGSLSAQNQSTLQAKEDLRATTGANYDAWKMAQAGNEVAPNKLLSEVIANGEKTMVVRLGWELSNQDAATTYESKLSAQPGVLSVNVDHNSNTVEMTVKEEDEHEALKSYFDIE